MKSGDYLRRQAQNDASRTRAENDHQPWSEDEIEWLQTWDGTEGYLVELAELLGRTVEACRQRFYTSRRGVITRTTTTTKTKTTTTTYRGWMEDDGDGWD